MLVVAEVQQKYKLDHKTTLLADMQLMSFSL